MWENVAKSNPLRGGYAIHNFIISHWGFLFYHPFYSPEYE